MRKAKSKEEEKTNKALDELIAEHGHTPEAIFGEKGLVALLTKTLVERALGAELAYHLKTGRSATELEGEGPSAAGEGGELRTADQVEELLVEEVRRLGSEAMHQWAAHAEERTTGEFEATHPRASVRKKKS